jgi:hypothetical protein
MTIVCPLSLSPRFIEVISSLAQGPALLRASHNQLLIIPGSLHHREFALTFTRILCLFGPVNFRRAGASSVNSLAGAVLKQLWALSILGVLAAARFAQAQGTVTFTNSPSTNGQPVMVAIPNDNLESATVLSGFFIKTVGTNSGATVQLGEPSDVLGFGHSVWYRWIAPADGTAEVSAGYFTTDVYKGDAIGGLSRVADSFSNSNFTAHAGTVYSIAVYDQVQITTVGALIMGPGVFTLTVELATFQMKGPPAVPRPSVGHAVEIEFTPLNTNQQIAWLEAFADTKFLGAIQNPPFRFSFTPSSEGPVVFSASGADHLGDQILALPSSVIFGPTNDAFADAAIIPSGLSEGTFSGNGQFATAEPGEPEHYPGYPASNSVWWRWKPLAALPTEVGLSTPFSALSVYKGNSLDALERVGSLKTLDVFGLFDPQGFSFITESNATYYIACDGPYGLSWSLLQRPPGLGSPEMTQGGFQLQVNQLFATNPVVFYTSTNLVDWMPFSTNLPASGQLQFLDPGGTNVPVRFYRAVQQ